MKKTLFLAAIVALAACGQKKAEGGAAADSTAVSAPAPAATDSAATMSHDSTSMSHDSTMARDTAKK